jgi:uncharacterized membrane protein YfcA
MPPSMNFDIHTLTLAQWAVLAAGAFFLGLSKTGLPGAGILAIPFIAAVIPAKASTGLVLPMLIVGDLFAVAWYRRHAVWSHLIRLLPYAILGIVIGWKIMSRITDAQLRPLIGVIILVLLGLHIWRSRSAADAPVPKSHWVPASLGLGAGITTMLANAAGPIMTIYLMTMRLPKAAFIGTGAWYFLIVNVLKVPLSAQMGLINPSSLLINLALCPLIILGALLGIRIANRLPEKLFGRFVLALAALGALKLIL